MATMSDLSQLEVFARVVADGGFTAAAAHLGVSKSFVSRQVSALEDRLDARLLNRTTRKLTLTDVGAVFYARCRQILDELADAEGAVTSLQQSPRGTLRLAAPMSFGIRYVMPEVGAFLARHGELAVDVELGDRRVDLFDGGFDLAIRIGALADSSMIARKLATTRLWLVATREYLASRGTPRTPEDLRGHDCMQYAYGIPGSEWQLARGRSTATVAVSGRIVANNGDALLDLTLRGLGIALLPDFIVAPALGARALVHVLPEWGKSSTIWAVHPHGRHLSAKVRLFVDFLAERWATPPWHAQLAAAPR